MGSREGQNIHLVVAATAASLELLDLGSNFLAALSKRESLNFVLEALSFPVFRLLCWLEGRILADGGMGTTIDILDIIRSNAIS